ncbi:MAG TPA: MBL fold metallo-hydrolase [Candidatus Polarisedimenticolia bacterium]|nr:MBL fold metallo-hydrolase [Candidatus Polarisedimenticolia bacterium]
MKVRYWGVRGSIPVPGPSTLARGGNTPCVSIELSDGSLLVLDGGTGLRALGKHLMSRADMASGRGRATLLFTHRHWDHIQGLPFFEPAYVPGNRFDVHSPDWDDPATPLDDNVVSLQHNVVNFPVPYAQIRSAYRFYHTREEVPFEAGTARVHPVRMNHAGITLGYVITDLGGRGGKIAYLCDTAPWVAPLLGDRMPAGDQAAEADFAAQGRARVAAAASGADLVIHDTFFDEEGYPKRPLWGHSAPSHAVALCRDAGARRLHLFHFAPDLDDNAVAAMESRARAAAHAGLDVAAAAEGMEVTLAGGQ